jgi:HSP20 family protein
MLNKKKEIKKEEQKVEISSWEDSEIGLEEELEEGQLSIDVFQDKNNIIIKSTIAGVEPEDIDISFENDMITIRGKRSKDKTVREEDYFYQECYWGGFSRSIILPVEIQSDKINASIRNGVLTIKLPKAKKKDIGIKVEDKN